MAKHKITGWVISFKKDGIVHLVIVKGSSRDDAIYKLETIGCVVASEENVRQVCLVPAPGPDNIHDWPEYDFEKCDKVCK